MWSMNQTYFGYRCLDLAVFDGDEGNFRKKRLCFNR